MRITNQVVFSSLRSIQSLHIILLQIQNDCLLFKVVFAVAYFVPCCNIIPQWKQQGTQSNSVFEFTLASKVIQRTFYYSKPFSLVVIKWQICVKVNANGYIGVYTFNERSK